MTKKKQNVIKSDFQMYAEDGTVSNMRLHEKVWLDDIIEVTRVYGGWIYTFHDHNAKPRTSTFVPEPVNEAA